MDLLERLAVIEAIKTLRARYCRFIDTKAWDGLRTLLAPDVVLDLPSLHERGGVRGRDEFIALVTEWFSVGPSLHMNILPEIDVTSQASASAVWKQEHFLPHLYEKGRRHGHGYGYSYDTYVRREGVWLVQSVRLEPTFSVE